MKKKHDFVFFWQTAKGTRHQNKKLMCCEYLNPSEPASFVCCVNYCTSHHLKATKQSPRTCLSFLASPLASLAEGTFGLMVFPATYRRYFTVIITCSCSSSGLHRHWQQSKIWFSGSEAALLYSSRWEYLSYSKAREDPCLAWPLCYTLSPRAMLSVGFLSWLAEHVTWFVPYAATDNSSVGCY